MTSYRMSSKSQGPTSATSSDPGKKYGGSILVSSPGQLQMCTNIYFYFVPLLPLVSRTLLCLEHRTQMMEIPSEDEQDREAHRSHILALAGFSFTGLLALAVLDATLRQDFRYAVYYLLVSFLCYLSALNLQGYKSKRWHDQFATALMDAASLSLIMSIISILNVQTFKASFAIGLTVLALLVWGADHFARIRIQSNFLKMKKEANENGRKKEQQGQT